MCKILRKSSGLITRKKLSIQVARDIKQMGFNQVPVLEVNAGRVNEQVFK
jgi:predicted XRE-type DNA-binding protein